MIAENRFPAALAVAVLALVAITGTVTAQADDDWRPFAPSLRRVTGVLSDSRLAEASGAYLSRNNPGLIWTMGDSGNPPELYAIDSTGKLHATLKVAGATNIDWESLGHSRCDGQDCILIGDTGDNSTRRKQVTIYRVVEPRLAAGMTEYVATPQRLDFSYPDHPHDVEAIAGLADGGVLLVSKGTRGTIVAFTLPGNAWRTGKATARLLDTLPIAPRAGLGLLITGAAMSPNQDRLALRSYGQIFLFDRNPGDGQLKPHRWAACGILGLEPQGEGIVWTGKAQRWRFGLTSERGFFPNGTVATVDCTPP